ncbi:MAG: hypothetical protein R2746_10660 [Acidimicrobiales bacterium]
MAHALEGEVDAVRADRPHGLGGVDVGSGGDEVSGAELARRRLLRRVGVDGDDRPAARQRQALEHVEADAADADDQGRLADARLGPVEHGAGAGEHGAADERGRRQRHLGIDDHRLGLVDDRVLGEHAGVGELERLLAAHGERARQLAGRVAAVGGLAAVARVALAAVAQGGEHHVVAHLHLGDGVAHLLHHAGALVAEDHRGRERDGAVDHAHVGVAEAGGVDAHPDLVGADVAHLHVVSDLELPGPHDRLHRFSPST